LFYGKPAKDDARPLNGDTVSRSGSMTKVFTALLLADIVQHGEVKLDDPPAKYAVRSLSRPRARCPLGRSDTVPNKPGNEHRFGKGRRQD